MNIQNAHQVVSGARDVIGQLHNVVHGCNLGNSEAVWPVWMQCVQLVRGRLMQQGQKRGLGLRGLDWARVDGTKFSMGRKGEGEALRRDVGVVHHHKPFC
jgi:hypothetical protein